MSKTVNFIEAVNSGKRFRPVGNTEWYEIINGSFAAKNKDIEMRSKRFFNSQFELEEKSITITESEFDEICNLEQVGNMTKSYLKKRLGF